MLACKIQFGGRIPTDHQPRLHRISDALDRLDFGTVWGRVAGVALVQEAEAASPVFLRSLADTVRWTVSIDGGLAQIDGLYLLKLQLWTADELSMSLSGHVRKLMLFAVIGNVLPIMVAAADRWSTHPPVFFVGAAVGCVVPLLVTALPRRLRWTRRVVSLSGLVSLTAMQARSGGAASTYGLLLVMPMLWFGTQAEDHDIAAMLVVLTTCAFGPALLIGTPAYPPHWASATLLVMICASVATGTRLAARTTAQLTKRLRDEAILDPLTGLLNRRGWEQLAASALARAQRSNEPVSLVAFDLDNFKSLNDTRGHDHGDQVLRQTGHHIRAGLRAGDVIARTGGDEFLALLLGSDAEPAAAAITRLLGATIPTACSAGIATATPTQSLPDLQRNADVALYAAKAEGGGRCKSAASDHQVLRPQVQSSLHPEDEDQLARLIT